MFEAKRTLWYFHDRFYWDNAGLDAEDIRALVDQRERRLQRKLQTAGSSAARRRDLVTTTGFGRTVNEWIRAQNEFEAKAIARRKHRISIVARKGRRG